MSRKKSTSKRFARSLISQLPDSIQAWHQLDFIITNMPWSNSMALTTNTSLIQTHSSSPTASCSKVRNGCTSSWINPMSNQRPYDISYIIHQSGVNLMGFWTVVATEVVRKACPTLKWLVSCTINSLCSVTISTSSSWTTRGWENYRRSNMKKTTINSRKSNASWSTSESITSITTKCGCSTRMAVESTRDRARDITISTTKS